MNFRNFTTRSLVVLIALFTGSQAFAARTTTFFHNDGLGSVVAATNEAGQVLWRKDYAPFGEQIQTAPVAERTSYTGKQHDDLTGLTYFGGRNFDPELGRFVSVDPVGFTESNAMSFNRYLYVNNNPYKHVDPDGEFLNFAAKFILDVAINVAVNYITTGEMNVGGALKDSAIGILNPIPGGKAGAKLAMHMMKANKVAPSPSASVGAVTRVKPRKATVEAVKAKAPRNGAGKKVDPNTGKQLKEGEIDLGHVKGQEWRRRKEMHERNGSTRKDVIEAENNPKLYQLEDRASNRSHKYEKK